MHYKPNLVELNSMLLARNTFTDPEQIKKCELFIFRQWEGEGIS